MPNPSTSGTPGGTTRVEIVHEDPVILRLTDEENRDWYYLQQDRGTMLYGYPYQIYSRDPECHINLFIPLPAGLPILTGVTMP